MGRLNALIRSFSELNETCRLKHRGRAALQGRVKAPFSGPLGPVVAIAPSQFPQPHVTSALVAARKKADHCQGASGTQEPGRKQPKLFAIKILPATDSVPRFC